MLLYVSSYYYISVLILLHMCRDTAMYASSYCYICVLVLLYMCPHSAIHVYVSAADLERTLLHVRAAEAALLQVSFLRGRGCTLFVRPLLYSSVRTHIVAYSIS